VINSYLKIMSSEMTFSTDSLASELK
jgi:hypothetical protein